MSLSTNCVLWVWKGSVFNCESSVCNRLQNTLVYLMFCLPGTCNFCQSKRTLIVFACLQGGVAVMDDQRVSHSSPQHSGGQTSKEVQRQGQSNVVRCGWLRKQGGFVKTWHSRWFVLRGDQLHYYKDEEETKALVRLQTHWNTWESRQAKPHVFKLHSRTSGAK